MDKRLIEAVNVFLQASSNEELGQVLQAFPELLTQETEINAIFALLIAQAREENEIEKAEFFEQHYQMLKEINKTLSQQNNNLFTSLIQQAEMAEQHYLRTSDGKSLDISIQTWEQILQNSEFDKIDDNFQLTIFHKRAVTYLRRYREKGELADLDTALYSLKSIVARISPSFQDFNKILNSLGDGLTLRYLRLGELDDIQKGIQICQQAVDKTATDSPELPIILNNLGNGFNIRYSRLRDIADLQAGITAYQQAIDRKPKDAHYLSILLNNLGNGLTERYYRLGELVDIEAGIIAYQQAMEKTISTAPLLSSLLNNLSNGFGIRYLRLGELADLQMAITLIKQTIEKTPPDSSALPKRLTNLGTWLKSRYSRLGELTDLQAGIVAFQQAIDKTPLDSPDLPRRLANLGVGLRERYSYLGELTDLQTAIELYQQAIAKTSLNSPDLLGLLNNLGNALKDRYLCLGQLEDLQVAIETYQEVINKTPLDYPDMSSRLSNLGEGLKVRYSYLGELKDLQEGIKSFRQSIKLGEKHSTEKWLSSTCGWLNWAFERNSWAEIEEAYPALQKASKQLVEKQLLREHQEAFLQDTQGIAVKVAYARIQTGQLEGAVEALEQGVARLLSSALARSNADLTQLQQDSPELYERYQESLQAVNNAQRFYQNASENLREKAQSDWQTAETQFNASLANIRQLQGHENFLLIATDINAVKQVSQQQPLIYVFFTEKGGYALNVFQEQIQAIALPELTEATLLEKINSYLQAYNKRKENRDAWFNAIETMTTWLYQAVMQPILQNIPINSQITLIPIGVLNLLPLHAAYYTTTDSKRRYVLDDYTISYAPNALSLQTARKHAQIPAQKLLAINEPRPVKDASPLPSCTIEIQAIQQYFAQTNIFAHEEATRKAVKDVLNNSYSVLHFSCHGGAKLEDPLKTGLLMANNEMLTVQDFLNAQLNARLVSLSACETGIIGIKQVEEVVSLPTSLLQAGVAGVVASLWSVANFSTMLLMVQFYHRWFKEYPDNPAKALRKAQIWVRDAKPREKTEFLKTLFPPDEAKAIREKMGALDYSHPFFWAAFNYSGI